MAKRILTPIGEGERHEAIVPAVAALAQGAGSSVRLVRVFPVLAHVDAITHEVIRFALGDGWLVGHAPS